MYAWEAIQKTFLFMGITGIVPIAGQMPLGEATGIDILGQVWKKYHEQKHLIPRVKGGRDLGVSYLGDAPEGYFTYFSGGEVEKVTKDNPFVK